MFFHRYVHDFAKTIRQLLQYIISSEETKWGAPLAVWLGLIMLTILILIYIKSCKDSSKRRLGILPLDEIQYLKDIILEVHYAACYCGAAPRLVDRCKLLLELYPAACDVPMYKHCYTPFLLWRSAPADLYTKDLRSIQFVCLRLDYTNVLNSVQTLKTSKRACWNGCAELISYMISIGADTRATTDAGEGAFYLATYWTVKNNDQEFEALKVLIVAGVDVNHRRADGLAALDLARARGPRRLARWLVRHGAVSYSHLTTRLPLNNN